MKKLWRLTILLSLGSFIMAGCNDNDDPKKITIREKPAYWTRLLGPNEADGQVRIKQYEWMDFEIVSGAPGSFITAVISKTRRDDVVSDGTLVKLTLDYKQISLQSFTQTLDMGLSEQNYSGVVRLEGGGTDNVETLVLGYAQPLHFDEVLVLSVKVDDLAVDKLLLTVTFTKMDTGDDEGGQGGDGQPDYP